MADQAQDQSKQYQYEYTATSTASIHQYSKRYNPWVLTCERWSQLGQYIALPINPSDITWHIPLKVATEQASRVAVSYVWRNHYLNVSSDGGTSSQNSLLQDFEIALTFNSGNIAPMINQAKAKKNYFAVADTSGQAWEYRHNPRDKADELAKFNEYSAMSNDVLNPYGGLPDPAKYIDDYDTTIPLGVQNLYRVLALVDEPRITYVPGSNRNAINANRICLVMNTPAFPNMVVYGHINQSGVAWEESADSPNAFDITLTLVITETQPKLGLDGLINLLQEYKRGVGADGVAPVTRDQLYETEQRGRVRRDSGSSNDAGGSSAPSANAGDNDAYTQGVIDEYRSKGGAYSMMTDDAILTQAEKNGDYKPYVLGSMNPYDKMLAVGMLDTSVGADKFAAGRTSLADAYKVNPTGDISELYAKTASEGSGPGGLAPTNENAVALAKGREKQENDRRVAAEDKLLASIANDPTTGAQALAANRKSADIKKQYDAVTRAYNVPNEVKTYWSGVFDSGSGYSKAEKVATILMIQGMYGNKSVASRVPGASRKGPQSS